ncbi:mitochondrial carrier family [Micromonas pusilla CCMP1545]|uniref:Mitochondrial carrier family n=2 Tax=Micromonas pusilla TaxID=38833 RepID=C1N8G7_MICPC|nr:mitochondrial carrier family [Micromonas pusilla CCMP1545]EEH51886.1 mitochondrial carrier family [Micromonas pusilla CCMP1545]|eukprot:XP_003064264.1 mitochondrial carrier family [Micromonas pusilla CCMP1545]
MTSAASGAASDRALAVAARAPMPVLGDLSAAAKGKKAQEKTKLSFGDVMKKASQRAFRGGAAGFAAGVVQVGTFMWMRTTMNYQYANGGTLTNALQTLYKEGGIPRFYRGVSFAIIQNPLSRFGDTAANTGILVALGELCPNMPIAQQTAFASLGGASWRIALTPVDTFKTTLQVQGANALALLKDKVKAGGIGVLYGGAAANFAANWVGNYPWFVTFNALQANIPKYDGVKGLARNAFIGMCASFVSDCVSNSLRVVKTIKQTSGDANLSYVGAVKGVIAKDGVAGLFGRGLKTRLITNIAQSMVFSVFWKAIEGKLNEMAAEKEAKKAGAGAGGKKGKTGSMTLATLPALKGGVPPLVVA